jgi:glutamate--cysteine ligase
VSSILADNYFFPSLNREKWYLNLGRLKYFINLIIISLVWLDSINLMLYCWHLRIFQKLSLKEENLFLSKDRLNFLCEHGSSEILLNITRGIEKESLRVTKSGTLSQNTHSKLLGSALTHPQITTDFSEALLEFITPPLKDADEVIRVLEDAHCYTHQNISDELLWTSSMPCQLSGDSSIPIGIYGSSNIGKMKHIYRVGLGHRYGKLMQTVAGIHYNFSVSDEVMDILRKAEKSDLSLKDFKTKNYFSLIRNFRRCYWLLLYLFGASPAVCRSFAKNREHRLVEFDNDEHSLHLPYATSLRMSDLGYQSKNQEDLIVNYNSLDSYIKTLRNQLIKPFADYEVIGLKDSSKNYKQLNSNILQIENEFYSPIRPKRSNRTGQAPLKALSEKGVEYIEVRCIDLNPFLPLGIDRDQIDFMDLFLLTCLLSESLPSNQDEHTRILNNQKILVNQGRSPGLMLHDADGTRSFEDWSKSIFQEMYVLADILDKNIQTKRYNKILKKFEILIESPSLTPSGKILDAMKESKKTFFQLAMDLSLKSRKYLQQREFGPDKIKKYTDMAIQSHKDQSMIEAADSMTFSKFLKKYYEQYDKKKL